MGPFFYLNQVHGVEVAAPRTTPRPPTPGTPQNAPSSAPAPSRSTGPVADAAASVEVARWLGDYGGRLHPRGAGRFRRG